MASRTTAGIPVLQHVRAIAGLGPRLAGGPAANEAARYVASHLAGLGMTVREERVPWPAWHDGGSTLEARGTAWQAVTGTFSPPADVTARLRVVRDAADLATTDVAGRIVVVPVPGRLPTARALSSGVYGMLEPGRPLVAALRVSGAAALVTVAPDDETTEPLTTDPDLPMPHVTVPASVGRCIESLTRARLVVRAARRPGSCVTVSGLTPAAAAGAPRVVLLAHLDSADGSTGVWDNASGVATVLAATQRLLRDRPDAALELLAVDGQEQWGVGVLDHVADPARIRDVTACVNVDGVGLGDRPTTFAPMACPRDLAEPLLELIARGARAHPWVGLAEPWWRSDHYAYATRGIPCVAVTSGDTARGREVTGADDDLDRLDETRLSVTVDLVAEVAATLADVRTDGLEQQPDDAAGRASTAPPPAAANGARRSVPPGPARLKAARQALAASAAMTLSTEPPRP